MIFHKVSMIEGVSLPGHVSRTGLLIAAVLAVLGSSSAAIAKTDVSAKVAQLKENTEASRANLKQYEDAIKVVDTNLAEADKALAAIEQQKRALKDQATSSQSGKAAIESNKLKLAALIQSEQKKVDFETQQINELKATLAKLESNVQKRQSNIAAYREKVVKSDSQLASWSDHARSSQELDSALDNRAAQVRADQAQLKSKKAVYAAEIAKWKKEVRTSDRMYAHYSALNH
jgi:chromosome segregation ATPase